MVGRLSARNGLQSVGSPIAATVTGIMIRTREQTSQEFLATVRTARWEVVIAELVLAMVPTR